MTKSLFHFALILRVWHLNFQILLVRVIFLFLVVRLLSNKLRFFIALLLIAHELFFRGSLLVASSIGIDDRLVLILGNCFREV